MSIETVRIRSRLVAVLAVVTLSFGVVTAGTAHADDSNKHRTCILLSAKLVGSSGGRYHTYDLTVRLINYRREKARIVAIVSNEYGHHFPAIGATVGSLSSATRTTRVSSPHGASFRVTNCTWSRA